MEKSLLITISDYLENIIKNTEWENHVFLVGGCVRDLIMNNDPNDIDIVIDKENGGINFTNWLFDNNYLMHEPILYPTYGTSMFELVKFPDIKIEGVQTRKEQYKDKLSRNPETSFGTIYEDALRRDLTINALYYDISNKKIIDPNNKGIHDIENKIINTTSDPDIIFNDDPLRMMRVIRFASRYKWNINSNVIESIKRNVYRINIISKERIHDELNKMLELDNERDIMALNLMKETGLLSEIIPEIGKTYNLEQNKFHVGPVWDHTIQLFKYYNSLESNIINKIDIPIYLIKLSLLLHDIGKIYCQTIDDKGIHFYKHEMDSEIISREIMHRLKYSNNDTYIVAWLVYNHMRTKNYGDNLVKAKPKQLRKLLYEASHNKSKINLIYPLMILIECDNNSHKSDFCIHDQLKSIISFIDSEENQNIYWDKYELPINGNDIMEYHKIKNGPDVNKYLENAKKICFANPLISKEQLLKQAKIYNN